MSFLLIDFSQGYSSDPNTGTNHARTSSAGGTVIFGSLTSDTTWTPLGNPHLVTGDFTVNEDATLTIEPGVYVELSDAVNVIVRGRLDAAGTEQDSIHFSRGSNGRWQRLRFYASRDNVLEYCAIDGSFAPAADYGASVSAYEGSSIRVTNCHIWDHVSVGVMAVQGSHIDVESNIIHDAKAGVEVFAIGGPPSTATIVGNLIWSVQHDAIDYGGGAEQDGLIAGNTVWSCGDDCIDLDPEWEGYIYDNIALDCGDKAFSITGPRCYPIISNCIGARARYGLKSDFTSDVTLINCTFSDNSEYGIWCKNGSSVDMTNCIVWNSGVATAEIQDSSTVTMRHSDVNGGWDGIGNIDSDPRFIDPVGRDYHIGEESPCIDAGWSDADTPSVDIDGDPRWDHPDVENSGGGDIPYVDIGADEFFGETSVVEGGAADIGGPSSSKTAFRYLRVIHDGRTGEIQVVASLTEPRALRCDIFDIRGRRLLRAGGNGVRGSNELRGELATKIPSGVLFFRVRAGEDVRTGKVVTVN
jgi:hypothetical protein